MPSSRANPILRYIRELAAAEETPQAADRELLECYLTRRDEAAFALLVRRHGPMVLRLGRRILQNPHDAEDVLQATFLVLSRKAASLRPRESLGGWLYCVAYRIAQKARVAAARRRKHERRAAAAPAADPLDQISLREAHAVLDQELNRLADKFRVPLVLCYLEGLTRDEAAQQLGWPPGILKSRLEQGRERLQRRLAARGLMLSAALVASLFGETAAGAAVPALLLDATVKATTAATSPQVAALAEGVLQAMVMSKLKTAAAGLGAVLLLGLAAAGALTRAQPGPGQPAVTPPRAVEERREPSRKQPAWRETLAMKHEHPVAVLACAADWSAAGDEGGNLFAWETKTGKNRTLLFKGGKDTMSSSVDRLQFTPDGQYLYGVIGGGRGLFRFTLKDRRGGGLGGRLPLYLGVSADGETWLEGHNDRRTLALRPNAWSRNTADFETIACEAEIGAAVLSADDKWLAVATKDGTVHLHERATLRKTHTLALGKGVVITTVQFSPDGERFAVAQDNALARVYETRREEEVATLKGHRGIVFALAFSPDGKKIATGGDDNTARVWDAGTGKALAVLEGHTDSVRCVGFAPDGATLVTGSADKSVKLWKIE